MDSFTNSRETYFFRCTENPDERSSVSGTAVGTTFPSLICCGLNISRNNISESRTTPGDHSGEALTLSFRCTGTDGK